VNTILDTECHKAVGTSSNVYEYTSDVRWNITEIMSLGKIIYCSVFYN